jgi:hypothetical protein
MDTRDGQALIDADIDATKPTPLARVGAALVMLGGAIGMLNAFQAIVIVGVAGWLNALPAAIGGIGIVCIPIGIFMGKGRAWAAISGSLITLLLLLLSAAWVAICLRYGFFSCYTFLSASGASLAAIGAILAIGPCLKSTAARKRLIARGMDTGM